MLLSIVIPTLNEEKLLPHLLASIRAQTFGDVEVIVADALSADGTRQIAERAGCRVIQGGLPAVGRNNGAAAAKGEILLFLDADVVLPDAEFLARIVSEFFRRDLDVATLFITPLSNRPLDTFFYGFYNSYIYMTQKIFPHAHGFCILARRSLHERIGGFDPEVRLAEDHDYAQRAGKAGTFGVLTEQRITVSTRRFRRDGHLKTACKYILCELHMWTLGSVKTDIFRYRFGYGEEEKSSAPRRGTSFLDRWL